MVALHAMRRATWWTQVVEIIKEGRQPLHRHLFANCALVCTIRAVLCHLPTVSMSKSTSHRTQTFKYKLQPMGAPAGGNSSSNDTHNSHGFGPSGCKKKAVGQNKAGGHGVRGGVRVPCLLQNSSYCLYFEKDEDLSGVAGWMLQGFCVRFRHPYQYICVAYAYVMASATRHEQRQVTKLTE